MKNTRFGPTGRLDLAQSIYPFNPFVGRNMPNSDGVAGANLRQINSPLVFHWFLSKWGVKGRKEEVTHSKNNGPNPRLFCELVDGREAKISSETWLSKHLYWENTHPGVTA